MFLSRNSRYSVGELNGSQYEYVHLCSIIHHVKIKKEQEVNIVALFQTTYLCISFYESEIQSELKVSQIFKNICKIWKVLYIMGLQRSKDSLNGKIIKTTLLFSINFKQPHDHEKGINRGSWNGAKCLKHT